MEYEEGLAAYVLNQMREGLTLTTVCEEITKEGDGTLTCPMVYAWLRDKDAKLGDPPRRFLHVYREAEEDRRMKWEDLAMLELRNITAQAPTSLINVAKTRSAMYRQGSKDGGVEILSTSREGGEDGQVTVVIRKFMPTMEE